MIDWKFIGQQAVYLTIAVLCGFVALGIAGLAIKGYGALLCGTC